MMADQLHAYYRVLQRIDALVSRYYSNADEDTKAVISNLTGIYARLSDVVVAQARELDHWARAARDAEEQRDEALELAARADDENARMNALVQEYEAHRCEVSP